MGSDFDFNFDFEYTEGMLWVSREGVFTRKLEARSDGVPGYPPHHPFYIVPLTACLPFLHSATPLTHGSIPRLHTIGL